MGMAVLPYPIFFGINGLSTSASGENIFFPDWKNKITIFNRKDGTFIAPNNGWVIYTVHDQKRLDSVSILVDDIAVIHTAIYFDCNTGMIPVRQGSKITCSSIAAGAGDVCFVKAGK